VFIPRITCHTPLVPPLVLPELLEPLVPLELPLPHQFPLINLLIKTLSAELTDGIALTSLTETLLTHALMTHAVKSVMVVIASGTLILTLDLVPEMDIALMSVFVTLLLTVVIPTTGFARLTHAVELVEFASLYVRNKRIEYLQYAVLLHL